MEMKFSEANIKKYSEHFILVQDMVTKILSLHKKCSWSKAEIQNQKHIIEDYKGNEV
jgi:hypothetical protein